MATPARQAITLKYLRTLAERAHCTSFGTGYCWSLPNPYYTGHYKSKEEAARASLARIKEDPTNG